MKWSIVYFERTDTTQPAEIFENMLHAKYSQILGKLLRITDDLAIYGYRLGGGYIEKCRDFQGLWEIRIIYSGTLARELFGFDGERSFCFMGTSNE